MKSTLEFEEMKSDKGKTGKWRSSPPKYFNISSMITCEVYERAVLFLYFSMYTCSGYTCTYMFVGLEMCIYVLLGLQLSVYL